MELTRFTVRALVEGKCVSQSTVQADNARMGLEIVQKIDGEEIEGRYSNKEIIWEIEEDFV